MYILEDKETSEEQQPVLKLEVSMVEVHQEIIEEVLVVVALTLESIMMIDSLV